MSDVSTNSSEVTTSKLALQKTDYGDLEEGENPLPAFATQSKEKIIITDKVCRTDLEEIIRVIPGKRKNCARVQNAKVSVEELDQHCNNKDCIKSFDSWGVEYKLKSIKNFFSVFPILDIPPS